MIGRILFVATVRLICPIDLDYLQGVSQHIKIRRCNFVYRVVDFTAIEGVHCSLCRTGVIILDESIIEPFALRHNVC